MPKIPTYTLAWSPATKAYELYETRERGVLRIVPESPAWFAWLDRVSSFAFSGQSGHYTARKEAKQGGGSYWSAYLATGEQLTKKSLGKTAEVTLARLEHMAGVLQDEQASRVPPRPDTPVLPAQSETQEPSPLSLAATDVGDEGDTGRHPLLAQRRTPLPPLLATKLHVPRPRAQLACQCETDGKIRCTR